MPSLRAALLLPAALVALGALNPAQAGGGGPRPAPAATCRDGYVRPDFTALKAQLARARAQWNAGRPASYTYDLRQIAAPILFPDTRVTVQAGRVTRTDLLPGQQGEPNQLAAQTIEARFDDLFQTLQFQSRAACPDVQLSFDPALGYPTRLYSGMGDNGIADGFGEWSIRNFTPLK